MRIAVVGAGIVGVTTAYELVVDGHEVSIFDRHASVAAQSSFANAGVVAPGYVTPWAAPGMPTKVLRQLLDEHAAVRLARPLPPGALSWMWRWWRACSAARYRAHREQLIRLARYSQHRLHHLTKLHALEYEQAPGLTVLLRSEQDLQLARPGLKLLTELEVQFRLVDAAEARRLEPGLSADTPLQAALHLPGEEVGNCRQFAHLLRNEAQQFGGLFRFHRQVQRIEPGAQPVLYQRPLSHLDPSQLPGAEHVTTQPEPEGSESFDAIVVCAGTDAPALLRPLGLRVAMAPVFGYSVTAPLRHNGEDRGVGPRSTLMDERYKVAISRLGKRVRVAGSAEFGGRPDAMNDAALATLYQVLDDWFPACDVRAQAQSWKGARPMLPDGPPVIGPSGRPGVWLNLGHGSSGWALACGSARVLADQIAGRTPAIEAAGFGAARLY